MAVFGIGARYGSNYVAADFHRLGIACIGHKRKDAAEIFSEFRSLKIGDVIYMKSLSPSSKCMTVMGVGIVIDNTIRKIRDSTYVDENFLGYGVKVRWQFNGEYQIGKSKERDNHWHRRLGTFYEEYNRSIQKLVIRILLKPEKFMK